MDEEGSFCILSCKKAYVSGMRINPKPRTDTADQSEDFFWPPLALLPSFMFAYSLLPLACGVLRVQIGISMLMPVLLSEALTLSLLVGMTF